MTETYNAMANGTLMWIACTPGIFIVLYQSWLFYRKTRKSAAELGLTNSQMKAAVRSALITSIGPCFVMLTAMLTLMLYVGAPLAWLRVDFIGSTSYELQAADITSNALGIKLGSAEMDASFLATAALVMSLGCVPWVLFAAIFSDKMDKVNNWMSGGNAKAIPVLGVGALIGLYSSFTSDRLYPVKTQIFAVIAAAAVMFLIQTYNKKANKQWVKEWSLSICMVAGMVSATIAQYMGF